MRFWLDMGCDGFRVDMAGTLVKYDSDSFANIALWQDITSFLYAEYPNAVMVSEWGEPDHAIAGGFQMDFLLHFGPSHYNDLFHSDEPYFSHRGKGDASEFVKYYTEIDKKAGDKGFICVPSGNHDMRRLSYGLDEDEIKIVFAFLLSLPGVPFIYYGDEIGMRYVEGLDSVEGGYNRTGSRSPMQWNSEKNAGFSAGREDQLYIKLDPSRDRPTAEEQLHDPNSILGEVRRLISIRRETKSLGATGKIEFVYAAPNAYPLAYIRYTENEKLLIVINPSDREACFPFDGKLLSALYVHGESARQDGNTVVAPPRSASFIHLQ